MSLSYERRTWFRWGGTRRGWKCYREEAVKRRALLGLQVAVLGVKTWLDLGEPMFNRGGSR